MANLSIDVMINGDFELPSEETMQKWIESAIERDTELTILFVDAEEGLQLNSQYRHKDYATNVLTFDYQHEPVAVADLVICVPVLIREAQEQEKSFEEHLAHLLIHGALHAHGYDHMEDEEAEEMEMKEIKALMALGFDNPYADREYVLD
ncbi:MAG: rRNA maturation RNase YbeY [Burkholderiaceae bacterium]|nr:rRNA maturation RNase YbeY [Burkholderiaceae bacterium]